MTYDRELISNGNPMEAIVGFSRAVRVGPFISIGGHCPRRGGWQDRRYRRCRRSVASVHRDHQGGARTGRLRPARRRADAGHPHGYRQLEGSHRRPQGVFQGCPTRRHDHGHRPVS